MITVYTIAYNEEMILPYFIKWYRERFPNCRIVIHDNESTDDTVKIALENNCEVITYCTNNKLSDITYLKIKNNCWKDATTDWILVCDVDEMLDITQEELEVQNNLGFTIISSKAYNMYNLSLEERVENMTYGVRAKQYDKMYLFNKSKILEINYEPGCHYANPKGKIVKSKQKFNLLHFSYLGEEYIINRYKQNASRLSEENKKHGWGVHYNDGEQTIRDKFEVARNHYKENKDNFNPEEILIWKK
jgi:glycosyltransferase involved in cell wall biosynthesis